MRRLAKPSGALKGRFGRHLDIQRQPDRMFRTQVLRVNGGRCPRRHRQYDDSSQARTHTSKKFVHSAAPF